jgi:hypothetical protein
MEIRPATRASLSQKNNAGEQEKDWEDLRHFRKYCELLRSQ